MGDKLDERDTEKHALRLAGIPLEEPRDKCHAPLGLSKQRQPARSDVWSL